ncbi:MAG: Crp/Fnr family transcriptional regulator, partial [Gemmataceae bacterium]
MAISRRNNAPTENRLLARLPRDDFQRLAGNLEGVTFHWNDVLHKQGAPIRHVYFPSSGLLTHLVTMRDGTA